MAYKLRSSGNIDDRLEEKRQAIIDLDKRIDELTQLLLNLNDRIVVLESQQIV